MKKLMLALLFAASVPAAHAQVQIESPWVRATVAAQKASGAFFRITAASDSRLVKVSSPVANVTELHEMKTEDGVMKMRQIDALALPAGQAVELKPGGYHVMLMGLKDQIKEGDTVQLSLVVEGKDGKRETVEVQAPARSLTAGAAAPAAPAAPAHEGMAHEHKH
ncbi:copper chaperone PCu(A)C [Azoarcus indigens]|uniref:Copper(I)-binding protein n=1 Tax=Azoarcus indigens TaxID=29545 RepID=A0A4R6EH59_9RHOO|nr:copper chaperone PCu(A)C [Azoarcus indigens]NMG65363.1 copper chaperone PCu(A)C [Azoarcus indigens]TDN56747.1 hypothetical protein C7389_101126 [Azoarcus indigens]